MLSEVRGFFARRIALRPCLPEVQYQKERRGTLAQIRRVFQRKHANDAEIREELLGTRATTVNTLSTLTDQLVWFDPFVVMSSELLANRICVFRR
jgi:hypothetical protein